MSGETKKSTAAVQVTQYVCGNCGRKHGKEENADQCCTCEWSGSDCDAVATDHTGYHNFCAKHARAAEIKRCRDAVKWATTCVERAKNALHEAESTFMKRQMELDLVRGRKSEEVA